MKNKIPNNNIIEVALVCPLKYPGILDLLRGVFMQIGVKPEDVCESAGYSEGKVLTYVKSPKKVMALKKSFAQLKLKNVKFQFKTLKPKDWKDKWKVAFRPLKLTPALDVVPLFLRKRYQKTKRSPIYIETTNAFGSGMHETTQFTSQLIERCQGKFESFLDVGTGTGIQSIVAFNSGALYVDALDIDRGSLRIAKANLKENGYRFRKTFVMDAQDFPKGVQYDCLAANIITKELIRLKGKLVSLVKKDRYLILSGIMIENLNELKNAYRKHPLKCLKIIKGEQWAALLFKRRV